MSTPTSMRDAILQSVERAHSIQALMDEQDDTPTVRIGRSTLRLLLTEHHFFCGVALGTISRQDNERT